MRLTLLTALALSSAGLVSCADTPQQAPKVTSANRINSVKTTAYTHTEADHRKYKVSSAVGTPLKYGNVRSAAADWSVFPVGTVFKIEGDPHIYEVDDYGSALVGTNTIDLYKPTKSDMKAWGARKVNIQVIRWGSFSKSLAIMKDREKASGRVRAMVQRIEKES